MPAITPSSGRKEHLTWRVQFLKDRVQQQRRASPLDEDARKLAEEDLFARIALAEAELATFVVAPESP